MNSFARHRCVRSSACLVYALSALACAQAGLEKPAPQEAPVITDEIVGPGYRREYVDQRQPITQQQLADRIRAGKPAELDPRTGELIVRTFIDHLPANWIHERPPELAGQPIDSFGNPIVNDTPGLPAWAQRDVDALRAAIAHWRDELALQQAAGADTRETEGMLANFIGQAISRAIAIDDIVNIDTSEAITPGVARSILDYLHFYENIRFANQPLFSYQYEPTTYPARITDFAARHGVSIATVQQLEPITPYAPRGGQPSGCYSRTAFARGMTDLAGQTDIWVANGFDDQSADISTGLDMFYFYDCDDVDNNTMVRVSTNGYITFFQQGGGALDGINFTNDALPDAADTPNGYAAPWWDDLIVATAQGSTDRVSYKTEGAVDSRVFTVEWISISRFNGGGADYHYFQVKLFETTDAIEFHIGLDVSAWNPSAADSATTGIETFGGACADCGPNCVNTNNPPPPNDYRFTPFPRPDNDNCGNAIEVINGASVIGNLHRATPDGNANCGDSSNNRDVWYTFVARCNGTLHLDTCGSRDISGPTTGVDTVLSVHSGCPGTTANQLACSDDAGSCNANDSVVTVPMIAGQRVFIRVTHFGDIFFRFQSGAFRLNLNFVSTSAPANDNCGNATNILNGNTLIGNLLCASNDGAADCGSSATNPDAWYRFTALRNGHLNVSLCGSRNNAGTDTGPDCVISVHTGCPGTIANELVCNDDGFLPGCNTLDSNATASLAQGQQAFIRVSHFGDNAFRMGNGVFALHAQFSPCGSSDFNHDGDSGTDADIQAFFACLAGSCCPSCDSADFDGDGDSGTDADIEAFFRVLAGGSC